MLLRGRHDGEGECYHTSTTHSRRNFFSVSKNSLSIPSLIFLGREGLINQWLQNSKPCLGDLAPHIGMWEWLAFIIPGAPIFLFIHSSVFPGGVSGKESTCQYRRFNLGLIAELARSPGGENDNPLQHFCLKNSMDRGTW